MGKISAVKNIIWAAGIVICLLALFIGLVTAMVNSYNAEREIPVVQLDSAAESGTESKESKGFSLFSGKKAADSGNEITAGELNSPDKTKNAGEDYLSRITFVCGAFSSSLQNAGIDSSCIWAGADGNLDGTKLGMSRIIYPLDSSEVSVINGAMIAKPEILAIMLSAEELEGADSDSFISGYESLINGIIKASPETQILCCTVPVTATGSSAATVMSANEWLETVCTDCAVWYCDTASAVSADGLIKSEFSETGSTMINSDGFKEIFTWLETHAVG